MYYLVPGPGHGTCYQNSCHLGAFHDVGLGYWYEQSYAQRIQLNTWEDRLVIVVIPNGLEFGGKVGAMHDE